jgi:hypothetical protein
MLKGWMDPKRVPGQLMDYTPRGPRTIDGPKLRWNDQDFVYRDRINCANIDVYKI